MIDTALRDTLSFDSTGCGQIVLVLQGDGALGAYQAGVHEALDEAGIGPDWVIGRSIGAINASVVAGSAPGQRLPRLREFWSRMERRQPTSWSGSMPFVGPAFANAMSVMRGVPGFFEPSPLAGFSALSPETFAIEGLADQDREALRRYVDVRKRDRAVGTPVVDAAGLGRRDRRTPGWRASV